MGSKITMPPLSCSIRTNVMIDLPTRTSLVRVPASRIDDRGHVTHKARCPFCAKTIIDCDGAASGCWHVKELEHSRDGSHFIFERA